MNIYLVRHDITKDMLGFFWASRRSDLYWMLDEAGNPNDFEFARLKVAGGVFKEKAHAGEPDDMHTFTPIYKTSEFMFYQIAEGAGLSWQRFSADDRARAMGAM